MSDLELSQTIRIYFFSFVFYFSSACFRTNLFLFIMVFPMTKCPELEIKTGDTVAAKLHRDGGDTIQLRWLFFHDCAVTRHIPLSFAVPWSATLLLQLCLSHWRSVALNLVFILSSFVFSSHPLTLHLMFSLQVFVGVMFAFSSRPSA